MTFIPPPKDAANQIAHGQAPTTTYVARWVSWWFMWWL